MHWRNLILCTSHILSSAWTCRPSVQVKFLDYPDSFWIIHTDFGLSGQLLGYPEGFWIVRTVSWLSRQFSYLLQNRYSPSCKNFSEFCTHKNPGHADNVFLTIQRTAILVNWIFPTLYIVAIFINIIIPSAYLHQGSDLHCVLVWSHSRVLSPRISSTGSSAMNIDIELRRREENKQMSVSTWTGRTSDSFCVCVRVFLQKHFSLYTQKTKALKHTPAKTLFGPHLRRPQ